MAGVRGERQRWHAEVLGAERPMPEVFTAANMLILTAIDSSGFVNPVVRLYFA